MPFLIYPDTVVYPDAVVYPDGLLDGFALVASAITATSIPNQIVFVNPRTLGGGQAIGTQYLGQYASAISMTAGSRQVSDAAITSGTNVLTSATAAFSATDIGYRVIVQNALTATTPLVTTIASFTNSSTVGLVANAGRTVTASGAIIGLVNNATIVIAA